MTFFGAGARTMALVTGKTTQEHLEHLEEVLKRLENAGMRLKKSKCAYLLPSVEYLGHDITRDGLRTADSKVEMSSM